jgi:hypothetical protein
LRLEPRSEPTNGNVPIEEIHVDDRVLSRNRETGALEYERVSALIPVHPGKLVDIRVEGETNPLRPSIVHPFWVKRGDAPGAWINAGHMRVGDLLQTVKGEWKRVAAVTAERKSQTVYNLAVDKEHDYFVGQTGFLVHNAGPCGCGPGRPLNWGNRIPHVLRHGLDMPNRIIHGVFADNPIDMVNQAWGLAGATGITPTVGPNGNWNYVVPYPEAGLQGGLTGAANDNPIRNSIRIVTEPGCNNVVTAFPE